MKTIELSKFEANTVGTPWAVYFVYPKDGEPVLVKGTSDEVFSYVKENYPVALIRYTYWRNGISRGGWRFTSSHRYVIRAGRRWRVSVKRGDYWYDYSFRRLPKKWIPEFD